jgi:hypothetical protein
MSTRFLTILLLTGLAVAVGCSSSKQTQLTPLTEPQTQSLAMSMCDDVMFSVADACAQIIQRSDRADTRLMCGSIRLGTAVGAITAATSQNARVAAADMITLAALQRMALEDPRAAEVFDEQDRRLLHDTFARAEQTMLDRARRHVTEKQLSELYELINDWRATHPDRLGVTQVRLEEFALMRQTPHSVQTGASADVSSTSVLRLLRLDPMQGLDPATRQIYESRLFAERVAFWGQRMPLILGWQMELTTTRVLAAGGVKEVIDNTTKFTAATTQFSGATDRFAESYRRTIDEFPKERAALIEQTDRALDARVKALIEQTAAATAVERKAAVDQVGDEFSRRMTTLVGQLSQQVDARSTGSLDHAARLVAGERERALADAEARSRRLVDRMTTRLIVVILVGAVIVACVAFAYRRLVTRAESVRVRADADDGMVAAAERATLVGAP